MPSTLLFPSRALLCQLLKQLLTAARLHATAAGHRSRHAHLPTRSSSALQPQPPDGIGGRGRGRRGARGRSWRGGNRLAACAAAAASTNSPALATCACCDKAPERTREATAAKHWAEVTSQECRVSKPVSCHHTSASIPLMLSPVGRLHLTTVPTPGVVSAQAHSQESRSCVPINARHTHTHTHTHSHRMASKPTASGFTR